MSGTPATLKLKPSPRPRVLQGHPWVFANEVEHLLPAEFDGEAVACRDSRGRLLGTGVCNSRSQIVWRRFSWRNIPLDETFLREALVAAIARRESEEVRRVVWSESDDLPGLVVDQYQDVLVVQALTLAMDKRLPIIADLLHDLLAPRDIVFRNDAPVRTREGLPLEVSTRSGNELPAWWSPVGGIDFRIDLTQGQKTGFYLDQRLEHRKVARYARDRRVLDAFCNQGGFALHCAQAGATSVLGVDSSQEAVEQGRQNAAQNGLNADFETANVFDFLRRDEAESWDLVILDPPPFAKSRTEMQGALRGYKEINLRAIKRLSAGGILATYTCSHHMSHPIFLELLGQAASDARRKARVLEFSHQPPDHPVLPNMPESEYLRGFILRVD
jgi:23S rRNA (cytosine1962-C5)-methyltransferase